MAKFSVEEEDDEEFCLRSAKRIRTCSPLHDDDHHRQEQDQSDDADDETNSTARTNNSSARPVSVILSDPDVLDCSICFEPLTVPVFQCLEHSGCFWGCDVQNIPEGSDSR
ncbi:hypothetical protein KSS87_007392 [Heliosperma pusillum]|nr:hypothetical protein KSS87_007392 [Heliosperma pusillum]